jgi:hypothetical protein
MNLRRVHLIAGVALAGLALSLTGCSDSDTSADTKPAAASQPTTQQSAPTSAPASEPADPPAESGGSGSDFCKAIENGGDVDLGKWSEPQSDPALREQLTKRFNALADVAPDDLKQSMRDLAAAYELIQTGKVTEDDQATIAKYTAAIQAINKYMHANCNLKMPPTAAG